MSTPSAVNATAGQYLTFVVKGQAYGVPIATVREINQIREVTPVPDTPAFVKGVINLRGKVVPVVDIRTRLGIEAAAHTKETCVIVIDGKLGQVGGVVDSVSGVVDFTADNLEAAPALGNVSHSGFVMGMGKLGKDVVILLDILSVCSVDEIVQAKAEAQAA